MTSAEDMHVFLFNDKQDVKFAWTYPKPPTLVITAKLSSSGANSGAECNGIVSWIEVQKRTQSTLTKNKILDISKSMNKYSNKCNISSR